VDKNDGLVLFISHSDNGLKSMLSILSANESEALGNTKAFAEPVNKKRPGFRLLSTDCFIANNNSGRRCISSIAICSSVSALINPIGSSFLIKRTAKINCSANVIPGGRHFLLLMR